jgi:hypothetical protein
VGKVIQRTLVAGGEHDGSAGLGEGGRGRRTDATAGTGNESNLAGEQTSGSRARGGLILKACCSGHDAS